MAGNCNGGYGIVSDTASVKKKGWFFRWFAGMIRVNVGGQGVLSPVH